ncbi:MAG: tetratricopeptide repeat protein [Polyangiaceae bacterium]
MTQKSNLPEVPTSALRDHGNDERVDRIWQRLESNVSAGRPRARQIWLWAPAALVIVFGSGVFVGARFLRPAPAVLPLSADPAAVGDEAARPSRTAPSLEEPKNGDNGPSKEKRPLAPHGSSSAEPVVGPGEPVSPPTAVLPPVVAAPDWQALADRDDYPAAWQAVERQGGFGPVLGKATTAAQLMSLVDIARANGQRDAALQALRAVVAKHPNDPRAALAAYTLGDMLEKAGDRAGAGKAYATYRALSPKGDFAEDALARQLDSAIAQGNVDLAKQLAEQYAKDFPSGRRLGELRARVRKLAGEDAGAPAPGASAGEDDTPFDEVDDEQEKPAGQKPAAQKPAAKPKP